MELTKIIDRMIEIKSEQSGLADELSGLQAQVQKVGEVALENTKNKSVSYYGSKGKVTVTIADKVGNALPSYLTVTVPFALNKALKLLLKN